MRLRAALVMALATSRPQTKKNMRRGGMHAKPIECPGHHLEE
jgi:hypothetical protein